MAGITPNSKIKLYDIPDSDITAGTAFMFDSEADREKFFGNYLVAQDVKCTVVKNRYQELKVSIPLATAERCNYISFINPDYGNKIFYGIITAPPDYLNNNTTIVNYEIDWWYTDMFNVRAQASQMTREGLTNEEFPTEMMTNGGAYSTNEKFLEKMTSAEPLACDSNTEKESYHFQEGAGSFLDEDYQAEMFQVRRDIMPYPTNENDLTGICFVCPDFDKLDQGEITRTYTFQFGRIIRDIRGNTSNYIVKVPFTFTSGVDPMYGSSFRWEAFFVNPDSGIQYPGVSYDDTGYCKIAASEETVSIPYKDFNAIGSQMKLAYCIVIAKSEYVNRIISFLNSLDMSSLVLGVHTITPDIFALLCGDTLTYGVSGNQNVRTRNACRNGMYFPQTKIKKASGSGTLFNQSPKLMFYPYSYLTMATNDGNNNMEYRYEYMPVNKDTNDHDFALRLAAKYDSDGPAVIAAPDGYRQRYGRFVQGSGTTYHEYDINPEDSVGDSNYPQVPYTTDSWLANMANNANELIKQNTTEFVNAIGAEYLNKATAANLAEAESYGSLGTIISDIGTGFAAGGVVGALEGAFGGGIHSMAARADYMAKDLELKNVHLRADMHDAAYKAKGAASLLNGNPAVNNYRFTAPAYASPNFHAGTSIRPGWINGVGEKYIYAVTHTLRGAIQKLYNNFFKMYGYATKQFKIPSIFEQIYSASGTGVGNSYKPHFESILFYDFRTLGHTSPSPTNGYSRGAFYTQTDGLKLTGVNKASEEFIRRLFDAGCLFIRPTAEELVTPVEPTPTPITPAPYVPPTPVPTPTPTPTPVASLTFITNPKDMVFDSSNSVWIINQSSYAEGGTTPYTYAWKIKLSNNEIIDLGINSSVCAFAITSRDTLMSYDGAELYNTVTDADGNTADSEKATITVVGPEPPEPTPTEPTPTEPTPTEPTPTEPTPTEPTPTPTGVEFTTVSIDASSGARAVAVIRASVSGVDYSTDKYYSDMYFPGVGSNPGYWINGSYAMTFYSFYNYECRATQYCSPSEVVSKVRLRIEKDGNTYTSDEYIIDRTITWDTPVVATPAGAASNIKAVTVSNIANVSDGATIQFVGKPVGGENFTQVYGPVTITGGSATSGNIDTDNVESVCFVIVNGNNFVGSGEITLT